MLSIIIRLTVLFLVWQLLLLDGPGPWVPEFHKKQEGTKARPGDTTFILFFKFYWSKIDYSVVLIPPVQRSDSVIHGYILSHILFHCGVSLRLNLNLPAFFSFFKFYWCIADLQFVFIVLGLKWDFDKQSRISPSGLASPRPDVGGACRCWGPEICLAVEFRVLRMGLPWVHPITAILSASASSDLNWGPWMDTEHFQD